MSLTEMNGNNFIHIDQITKNYRDPASNIYYQALRGIDLKLKKGSISTIIGPSGAGKSTLLNILGGMMRSTTGNITVDGINLNTLNERELVLYRRQTVGFLWQFPDRNLLPKISVYDNILFTMAIAGYPMNKRKSRALKLLTAVGLADRREHRLAHLSGGEAQRASLAVALANEPLLLLADEPTGELDTETTLEVINYLKEINKNEETTMLVVTHDTRFEKLSGNAYSILDGTIASLKKSSGHDKIHLESGKSLKERMIEIDNIEQKEVSSINQFGMIKIPHKLREKYNFQNYARFIENVELGKLVLEPVEEDE